MALVSSIIADAERSASRARLHVSFERRDLGHVMFAEFFATCPDGMWPSSPTPTPVPGLAPLLMSALTRWGWASGHSLKSYQVVRQTRCFAPARASDAPCRGSLFGMGNRPGERRLCGRSPPRAASIRGFAHSNCSARHDPRTHAALQAVEKTLCHSEGLGKQNRRCDATSTVAGNGGSRLQVYFIPRNACRKCARSLRCADCAISNVAKMSLAICAVRECP